MILVYKYLGILLIPLIKLNIIFRIRNNKEIKKRHKERFGLPSKKKPSKKLIWIHAASVGEFKSADILINHLHKKYTVLITTTTLSAAKYAEKHYENKIIHQFAPLDISFWIKKFLIFWNPCLVIWIESDIWPITMNEIKEFNIKSLLVNVRMSPKSFNRWLKLPFFYKKITDCFSEIYAQSEFDKKRISLLTKRKIKFIGNLKLSNLKKNILRDAKKNIFSKKKLLIITFASTHEGEEEKILPVIKKLFNKFNNNLGVIIAPRHPERFLNIISLCQKFNLKSKLENSKEKNDKDILIVNSFGNLPRYFENSDIVFLGGSLIYKGGHNPIEPALHNCAIITGPHIYNWENIYKDMLNNKACLKIETTKELEKKIKDLLNNNESLNKIKKNAYTFSQKKFFNNQILFDEIEKQLNNVKSS